jgi:exodeoxyribonuclease VII large subunit
MGTKIDAYRQRLDICYHKLEKSHPTTKIKSEKQLLQNKFDLLSQSLAKTIQHKKQQSQNVHSYLIYYNFKLESKKSALQYLSKQLTNIISPMQQTNHQLLKNLSSNLNNLSPLATLSRGYSITLKKNTTAVITNTQQVNVGDSIETRLKSGTLLSQISNIEEQ